MVDNDLNQFTLWRSQQSPQSNPIPVRPSACTTPILSSTAQPPPLVTPGFPPATSSNESASSTPKGTIAGSVIGGLAAIAFLFCAWSLQRHRKRRLLQNEQGQATMKEAAPMTISAYSDNNVYAKPEMPSSRQPPQEMPLERDTGYDVEPYEMPNMETYEMPTTLRSGR